jgi:hypothetical protein
MSSKAKFGATVAAVLIVNHKHRSDDGIRGADRLIQDIQEL